MKSLSSSFDEIETHLRQLTLSGLPRTWFESPRLVEEPFPVNLLSPDAAGFESSDESPRALPIVETSGAMVTPEAEYAALSLEELRAVCLNCEKCRLFETRKKVVFGVGKAERPRLVFVGEGPGADEDRLGEPFVGKAGALLTAAITKGMGMRREDVYIANVVKCRPPENRAPLPDEVAACTPFLYRQLEILSPEVIVTLGQPAQLALSGVQMGITKLRGQWQNWRGVKLMPTFHPAYILRNPSAKRFFWEDLQSVMRELGLLHREETAQRTIQEDNGV